MFPLILALVLNVFNIFILWRANVVRRQAAQFHREGMAWYNAVEKKIKEFEENG